MIVLSFDDYQVQAQKLATASGVPFKMIQCHHFPDGEIKLTLPVQLPKHVIICRSLNQPNEKLIELLLTAKTARQLGVKTLTLVAPYLCYMRQDVAFNPGEAISQTIIGNFLAELFDNVITVDPHLHRVQHLAQAIPSKKSTSLSATSLMATFLDSRFKNPVLLAPDSEAKQWVKAVAEPNGWEYGVCNKIRTGDRKVEILLPEINLEGRTVIIVDDVVSSGRTLAVATRMCLSKQATNVDILVTHALFASDANKYLIDAGVRSIWSTDSISHESNVIELDVLLKEAILNLSQD